MRRRLIVLRPEPGNSATRARIVAAGAEAIALPLFAVVPLAWTPPNPADFDALVLTSANAARHAGPALAAFAHLPAVAVGATTARAATAAGLSVAATGTRDAGEMPALLDAIGATRALHLTGREYRAVPGVHASVAVYASDATEGVDLAALTDATALIHSARAGARLAELVDAASLDRARVAVAAISPAALAAAGDGWHTAVAAAAPDDDALISAALSIDRPGGGGDKAA